MAPNETQSVYEQTYRYYLDQLKTIDFTGKEAALGIGLDGDSVLIPYHGRTIRLTDTGLSDENGGRPLFSDCVVICRYLIMCPKVVPKNKEWVAFRDFPAAGPLTAYWKDAVERPLAKAFSGDLTTLEGACDALGGSVTNLSIACDLHRRFMPLPKVPLLLVFNAADEDFPAAASILFEKRADAFLDAESLAILGHGLSFRLCNMRPKDIPESKTRPCFNRCGCNRVHSTRF